MDTPQGSPEPRSADLTRPLKLSRLAIFSAATVTAAMFGILGLGVGRDSLGVAPRKPSARIEIQVPNAGGLGAAANLRQIGITPDGSAVVYVMQTEAGENAIAFRRLDGEGPVLVDDTGSFLSSEISNKGRNIGAPRSADAGERVPQSFARNRMSIIVTAQPGQPAGEATILDTKTGIRTTIVREKVVEMRYAAGHLVYVREDGSLWVAAFDEKTGLIKAAPVQMAANVSVTKSGIAQFAVSKNGNIAYLPEGPRTLVQISRGGRLRNLTEERHGFSNPRYSPDGSIVSVDFTDDDGRDIWFVPAVGGKLVRVTREGDSHDAAWVPLSNAISFTSFRRGSLGIYRSQPGVRDSADSVFTAQPLVYSGEWLKDASAVITTAANLAPGSRLDIASIDNGGRGPLVPILVDRTDTHSPAVSPDKRWLAYVSNRSGRDEIYVSPWRGDTTVMRVSSRGGTEPIWSADGKELFFKETATQYLIAMSIKVAGARLSGKRELLFPVADMAGGYTHANYDVSPDGRSFTMVRRSSAGDIRVLQNFPEILRRLRPSVTSAREAVPSSDRTP